MNWKEGLGRLEESGFLFEVLDKMPAIVYVNRYERAGDAHSLRNIWSSQYAQAFVGMTQERICGLGFELFVQLLHPDDLAIIEEVFTTESIQKSGEVFTYVFRVRSAVKQEYIWLCGNGVTMDFHEDQSPKTMINVSFEISSYLNAKSQLSIALKEIARLEHELQCKSLSKREKEVLKCISGGKTDKQIGQMLFISEATAKTHRNKILHKLNLKNTASLVAFAVQCGLD
jgi:DNA-binding CsgD family transcriptional regulator